MGSAPAIAFSHVGIYVRDFAAMEDFYTRALGFTVTDRGELGGGDLGTVKLVFLSRDPREHHQIVLATGRPDDLPFNVVNQISFRVPSLGDLRRLHDSLAGERISDVQPVSHGNAWSVYLRDPDGNRLEFFADSPWYVQQPMRVPLDLGRSDDEIMAWTETECRKLPGFRPQAEWRAELAAKMKQAQPGGNL